MSEGPLQEWLPDPQSLEELGKAVQEHAYGLTGVRALSAGRGGDPGGGATGRH